MKSTHLNDHHPHTHLTQATVTLASDATALHELSFKLWDVSGVWTDGWMNGCRKRQDGGRQWETVGRGEGMRWNGMKGCGDIQ